ncbi:MAG: hypothetical protein ACI395_04635 [Candidatus Cryptobacteroides sp.]
MESSLESPSGGDAVITERFDPRKCFIRAYCSLICRQNSGISEIRRSDFLRSAGITGMDSLITLSDKDTYLRYKDEVAKEDYDLFAAALSFLDVHKAINELNFSDAYNDIVFGLQMADSAGNACFKVIFLVLRGWLERYWGWEEISKDTIQSASTELVRLMPEGEPQDKFCKDLVSLSASLEDSGDADRLARFYVFELTKLLNLRDSLSIDREYPEFYSELFGSVKYQTALDAMPDYSADSDEWIEPYSKLTPNQKRVYDFVSGRSLMLDWLNTDSFILVPGQIVAQYQILKNSRFQYQSLSIFNSFDVFLRTTRSHLNLKTFEPLLDKWFDGHSEKFDELVGLICSRGNLQTRCEDVLSLVHYARKNLLLDNLKYLHLALAVYRHIDSVKDNEALSKLYLEHILMPICNGIRYADARKVRDLESLLLSGEKDRKHLKVNSLFKDNSIRSVLLKLYHEQAAETVELLSDLGESEAERKLQGADMVSLRYLLKMSEPFASETAIGQRGAEGKIRVETYRQKEVWHLVDENTRTERFLYIFNKSGNWEVQGNGLNQSWSCESRNETVYPVTIIDDWRKHNGKKDAKFVILLMSGVFLDRTTDVTRLQGQPRWLSFFSVWKLRQRLENNVMELLDCVKLTNERGELGNVDNYVEYARETRTTVWELYKLYEEAVRQYSSDGHVYVARNPSEKSVFARFGLTRMLEEYARLKYGNSEHVNFTYEIFFRKVSYKVTIDAKLEDGSFKLQSFTFEDNTNGDARQFDNTGICDDIVLHRLAVGDTVTPLCDTFIQILKKNQEYIRNWGNQSEIQNAINAAKKPLLEKIAKNAIMTRNISHNLGSHVMAYLKYQMESMGAMLSNNVFDCLFEDEKDYLMLKNQTSEWLKKKQELLLMGQVEKMPLPFLKGLGKFISYIQERQDFIATIATDYRPYCIPLNFKDFIYDELNPDKRVLRHPNRQDSDIPDNILLGNIARSEGLFREHSKRIYLKKGEDYKVDNGLKKDEDDKVDNGSYVVLVNGEILKPDKNGNVCHSKGGAAFVLQNGHDIVLKFRSFDGNPVEEKSSQAKDLDAMRRITFNIPGGTTGRHAFFSIVENVIRNAAKHGSRKAGSSLELTFDVYEQSEFETRAPEDDNIKEELPLKDVFTNYYNSNDYYYVTLTDNQPTDYEKLVFIRQALVDPYVKDQKMCEGFKGFKEMRICSAFLMNNGLPESFAQPLWEDGELFLKDGKLPHDTEWGPFRKSYEDVPTFYARLTRPESFNKDLGDSKGFLQFIFPVKRQLEVLVVTDRLSEEQKNKLSGQLTGFNWALQDVREFEKDSRKRNSAIFVLLDDISGKDGLLTEAGSDSLYNRLRPKTNFRMLRMSKTGIDFGKDFNFGDDFENLDEVSIGTVREKILKTYSNYEEGDVITISDDKVFLQIKSLPQIEGNKNNNRRKLTILDEKVIVGDGLSRGKYLFRKHYETEEEFNGFQGNRDSNLMYVEGISGSNSTDRLIRNEKIDLAWYFRHLRAVKMKIGIFDERLAGSLLGDVREYPKDSGMYYSKDYKGVLYADKNVWIFNIEKDPSLGGFTILGVDPDKNMLLTDKVSGKRQTKCCRVATIRKDGDGIVIDVPDERFKTFDKLSVHQGLLDKIYEEFNIKQYAVQKEEFTKQFFESFSKETPIEEVDNQNQKHYFLPGFSIHSGRSKPAVHDMPQRLPFVQFSLLEHAVLDCKYELVELLDTVAYE